MYEAATPAPLLLLAPEVTALSAARHSDATDAGFPADDAGLMLLLLLLPLVGSVAFVSDAGASEGLASGTGSGFAGTTAACDTPLPLEAGDTSRLLRLLLCWYCFCWFWCLGEEKEATAAATDPVAGEAVSTVGLGARAAATPLLPLVLVLVDCAGVDLACWGADLACIESERRAGF